MKTSKKSEHPIKIFKARNPKILLKKKYARVLQKDGYIY